MSLLQRIGLSRTDTRAPSGYLATIRAHLEALPEKRAEFVAAFAGLLVRVAHADDDISAAERSRLHDLIAAHAGLSAAESTVVAEIAVHQATHLAGIDYASLTNAFNELATEGDKESLIDCLYAVATADQSASVVEDEEIRKVSRALLLTHEQFIAVRTRYKEQLAVIQALRRT
jgi:uncharacterized tellurite resistance protein B-like protein